MYFSLPTSANGDRNNHQTAFIVVKQFSDQPRFLHIMQLTDCFNIYRTHLHGIEENKDKVQGMFDLHVSVYVSFSYDVRFVSDSIP